MKRLFYLSWTMILSATLSAQKKCIIIEGDIPSDYKKKEVKIVMYPLMTTFKPKEPIEYRCNIVDRKFKLAVHTDSSFILNAESVFIHQSNNNSFYIIEPGDSITIHEQNDSTSSFSGRGAEKFQLWYELVQRYDWYVPQIPGSIKINKNLVDRFIATCEFLDQSIQHRKELLQRYQPKLSNYIYQIYSAHILAYMEHRRINAFNSMWGAKTRTSITSSQMRQLFDTHIVSSAALQTTINDTSTLAYEFYWYYYRVLNVVLYLRHQGFPSITNPVINNKGLYYFSKQKYTGLMRQKILIWVLINNLLKDSQNPEAFSTCFADFQQLYPQPNTIAYVQQEVDKQNKIAAGKKAPDFSLTDEKENKITLAQFKGKVVVLDFWFTGCKGCAEQAQILRNIETRFNGDTSVIFLSVSIDSKENFIASVKKGIYNTPHSLNLYTSGQKRNHPILNDYKVTSFPHLALIDADGNISDKFFRDPQADKGKSLETAIGILRSRKQDGPYVYYTPEGVVVHNIQRSSAFPQVYSDTFALLPKKAIPLKAITDKPSYYFTIQLYDSLTIPPTSYPMPEKLLALSDIEGNFDALRTLLQHHRVIDSALHWSFGKGHLVFNGDIFDRGQQVTECLWLLYKLEQEAQQVGGQVHFILGNHEIMNLTGDYRYRKDKYIQNARILASSHQDIYGENTELGRWLRTKNIVEKIGNLLFTHAGLSKNILSLQLSLEHINDQFRTQWFTAGKQEHTLSPTLQVLTSHVDAPYWYRGYYADKNPINTNDLLSLLQYYQVDKIITGHTIVSEFISAHFDRKIINLDTKHAEGKSEALLIMGNTYFRATNTGKLISLFSPTIPATTQSSTTATDR